MNCAIINKIHTVLSRENASDLQKAVLNERTMNSDWIARNGWEVCHIDDADLTRFVATAFIRYFRRLGVNEFFSVDTVDIFRSMYGKITLRKIPMSIEGINQACFGLPRAFEFSHPEYEWFLQKAFSANLFFSVNSQAHMLLLRDASSCITIAGDANFISCMVRHSRRVWYSGVPHDGKASDSIYTKFSVKNSKK